MKVKYMYAVKIAQLKDVIRKETYVEKSTGQC